MEFNSTIDYLYLSYYAMLYFVMLCYVVLCYVLMCLLSCLLFVLKCVSYYILCTNKRKYINIVMKGGVIDKSQYCQMKVGEYGLHVVVG